MVKLNIVKPPRINLGGKKMGFWKQIGMIVLGTTISLILTLLTAKITDNIQRAKDRRLSAMMVMSNIEKFARNLEEIASYMASNDSTAAWLLSKEVEELEFMPEEVLDNMLGKSFDMLYLTYDKSAENIFTNNMETWKNMGNVKFIDRVGECFSAMNKVEERWNKWVVETEGIMLDIKGHPEEYEGGNIAMKCLHSEKVRHTLKGVHYWRAWLYYMAATMRYHNQSNMEAIGISEQEVMDYTDAREVGDENQNPIPDFGNYYKGPFSSDSLTTFGEYDALLEEVKAGK